LNIAPVLERYGRAYAPREFSLLAQRRYASHADTNGHSRWQG
jgi:hypothetical protein